MIDARDPAGIYELVRDRVATYPGGTRRIDPMGATRWGARGTLRGGAGTPREKAELLAELYRRAGWEAEVMQAPLTLDEGEVKEHLFRAPDRPFAPEITERQIEKWRSRLGISSDAETKLTRIDRNGEESRQLAERIAEGLPENRQPVYPFDWRWRGATPVVRVKTEGETFYANLFSPGTPFGEAGVEPERLREATGADATDDVEVTLSTALASSPSEQVDLVKGTWPLEALVGRQVIVQMLPGLDLRRLAVATFRDIQTFIPALAIQGFDLDKAGMSEMSVIGDAISRSGDRIAITPDGEIEVDGRVLATAGERASVEAVEALEIEVDGSRYPNIRIDARARDAQGELVEGLIASDFRLEEDERSTAFQLSANRAAPRVLILSDRSGSMPSEYYGKGMDALVEELTRRVRAEHPHADVRWKGTSSHLWDYLTQAAGTDANLIVYATDGHVEGELTDAMRSVLANGPRVVIINVRGYDENNFWYKRTFQPMADATNGTVVPATDPAEAQEAILAYLRELVPVLPPYRINYGAPTEGEGERRVRLVTADGRVRAEGTYVAPAEAPPQSELAGLYLTVKVGRREVTRTLAGYDPVLHEGLPVTAAMLNETLGACIGTHFLSFEAAAPTFSAWLDDFITAKLSLAPLDAALRKEPSLEELEAIIGEGFFNLPPELFLQALELENAATGSSLTYEDGPRVLLYQAHPVFDADHFVRRVDILPFTQFATAADDPEVAFRTTLEKTARFAVAEAELYPTSTRSLLKESKLVDHRQLGRGTELSADQRAIWRRRMRPIPNSMYRIVPAVATPLAFWQIDSQTGSLLGILPNGSGGGSAEERLQKQLAEIDRVMSSYNMILGMMASMAGVPSIGGIALGIVAAYGQLLVRLYGAATLAITLMDASHIDDHVAAAFQTFACNVQKTIFTAAFGSLGEAFSGIETLIGALGGDHLNPFAC